MNAVGLVVVLFLSATSVFAGIDIKPGQWNYQNNIQVNNQQFDVSSQLDQALAQLPADQRAMMEKMAKNASSESAQIFGSGKGSSPTVCITQSMIDEGNVAPPEERKSCDYKVQKNTKDSIAATVHCKNGTKGNFTMKRLSQEKVEGEMDMKDSRGNKVNSRFTATWVAAKCATK